MANVILLNEQGVWGFGFPYYEYASTEVAKIIYVVHDEVKDKNFQLELSWVGKDSGGLHKMVPKNLMEKAEEDAKKSLEEDSDSDGDL